MTTEAAIDAALVVIAYSVTLVVRTLGVTSLQTDAFLFIALAGVVNVVCLFGFGVYRRIWSRTSGHGIVVIFNGTGLAVALLVIVNMLVDPRPMPLSVIGVAQLLAFVAFVSVRYRSRLVSGMTWRWNAVWRHEFPRAETRVLIVGAGESGQTLAWRLKYRSPGMAFRVVGFVDDDVEKRGMYVEGAPILGQRGDIPRLSKQHNVELIVLAIHNVSGEDFRSILRHCELTSARIKVIPNIFDLMSETRGVQLLRDVQAEDLLGRTTIMRHEAVDLSPVTGKVVLITGAAGSIGSELARQIATYEPEQAILLDNNESGLYDLLLEVRTKYPKVAYIEILGDVTDKSVMTTVIQRYRPQVVFHAAAYKHVPLMQDFPGAAIRTNVLGTHIVADLSRRYDVERFVLISSDKAVRPTNVMGATKRACELIIHAFASRPGNTLFTAVRFGNVLGSRGSVVPIFNRQIDMGGPITVTHPEMTRYFMSIPEAVNLVIHAACLTKGDDIFLLKMGEVIRIVDLAERMIRLRGLRPHQDIAIHYTGIRPGEKLDEELYGDDESPQQTVHPHIVHLNTWHESFDANTFDEQLAQLARVDYFDCEQATRALSRLMTMRPDVAIAAD